MITEPTVAAESSFSIDSIKEVMDAFDPASLLPELTAIFEKVGLVCRIAVVVGPALLVALGLVYLFLTPKEANHYIGYRCYFGMGSVQAWRFTQRLAGILFVSLGVILGAVALFSLGSLAAMEVQDALWKAVRLLAWEAGLTLLLNIGIPITAAVIFDRKGEYRRKRAEKKPVTKAAK